jgi:hypothetical protein
MDYTGTTVYNAKILPYSQIMDSVLINVAKDILKMDTVSLRMIALIKAADCVELKASATNASQISQENPNVHGNNFSHPCSCPSLQLLSSYTLLSQQYSSKSKTE